MSFPSVRPHRLDRWRHLRRARQCSHPCVHFGCNAHGNRPVPGSNANKSDRGSGGLTKPEPNEYGSPDWNRRPHAGGDEDPGEKKNPSGGSNHLDGRAEQPSHPGMLHCKRTKHRNPGARVSDTSVRRLDGTSELGRGPADITMSGLIPSEGSPIVNALLARHTTVERPAWAMSGAACHVVSPRRSVGHRGRDIQGIAGGVCPPDPDRSTEVSGTPTM